MFTKDSVEPAQYVGDILQQARFVLTQWTCMAGTQASLLHSQLRM